MPPSSSTNGAGPSSLTSSSSSKKVKSRSSDGGGASGNAAANGKSQSQLNANEKRVWQTIQKQEGHTINNEKVQNLFSDLDVNELHDILNTLLRKSLLNAQQDQNGSLQFIAFSKSEASTMGNLENDESIIFSHIRVAGNEGIWTKQLKVRTNLHQTVMTRCLKALESKGLIKAVKSVKFPTRKIYMLSSLTPSIELSGGPWYTDNELDTVFIDQLCTVLFQFISAKTWPGKRSEESSDPSKRPLFPASHLSSLPTAASCLSFLKKSNITDTDLQVENVQNLLDVLVYDGKVEKIPHVRMGHTENGDDDWTPNGKRAGYETESSEGSVVSSSDDEDESESDSDDGEDDRHKRKRKGRRSGSAGSSKKGKSKKKSTSKKSRHRDEDEDEGRKKKRKSKNNSSSKSISIESESDNSDSEEEESEVEVPSGPSSVFVYRAIRQIRVETGWIEAPCAHCPVFDFCAPGGPVNAEGCVYMRDWIKDCATMRAKELAQDEMNEEEVKVNGRNGHHVNGEIEYEDNVDEDDLDYDDSKADLSNAVQDEDDVDPYGGEEV